MNLSLKFATLIATVSLAFISFAESPAASEIALEIPDEELGLDIAAESTGSGQETVAVASENRWIAQIRQGGKTMVFLGLLSVLGLGCALERFANLRRSRIVPGKLAEAIRKAWESGDFAKVESLCSKDGSVLSHVAMTMLERRQEVDTNQLKAFAEDKAGRELRLEGRKSNMLSTVATLSPLLGLFGTVLGLLEAFGTVAAMGEMGDASVLADSIGKALVTTVAGLAIAMPALFVHNVMRNRLALYAVELEEAIDELVLCNCGTLPRTCGRVED